MSLKQRLKAGIRLMADGWARDLCTLYGLDPGDELHVAVRRSESDPDAVEVRVAPRGPRRRVPADVRP